MKQYAALVVLSLLLAGCDAAKTNQTPAVSINGQRVNVEVAQTVAERSRGLSNRPPLGADEGMVFVFPEPSTPSFWMNGMRFPLDLPVSHVLEVSAGWAASHEVQVGDQVIFSGVP